MAEVGTPSAVSTSTGNAGKEKAAPPPKPERPDEETYKNELAKAEKELKAAEERMVSALLSAVRIGVIEAAHWSSTYDVILIV